jgi:hypothetical protein
VDVATDAPELDPSSLRNAIGKELGAEAIAPDDARAPHAGGTLRVSIDRVGHALVVTYRARAEPITRTIDLPGDRASIERGAVLLAGNLARDEADELAAELRRRPAAPPRTADDEQAAQAARDFERLGQALARQSERGSRSRVASSVLLGAGLGVVGASLTLEIYGNATSQRWPTDAAGIAVGGSLMLVLAGYAVAPGNFDKLHELFLSRRDTEELLSARLEVEQAWLHVARAERSNRRLYGYFGSAAGAVGGGLAGAGLIYAAQHPGASSELVPLSVDAALSAATLAWSVYLATTPGPVESALHEYEQSLGHEVREESSVGLVPVAAPVAGGAIVGLGGRF